MNRSNKILILVNARWNETCLVESGLCRSMYANTATSKVQPYRFDSGLTGFSAGKSGKKVSFNPMLTVALIHVFKQPTIIKYKCLFHPVNKLS